MDAFRCFIVLILILSTSLAINIPSTPVWPSGRCTDKSLTIPSWIISNYKAASGTATFRVDNRAFSNGGIGTITCSPGKKECQSSAAANELRVTWEPGENGKSVIGFSGFWVCEDEGDSTIFTATGNTTVTSCVGPDCISPITYLAPGSLTLPVPVTPAQPLPPYGYLASNCPDVGKDQWTISDVVYKNYTKGQCKQWYEQDRFCLDPGTSGGNFIPRGQHLRFNITNNAIAHEIWCNFTPTYDNSNPPNPLRCIGGNFNEITLDITWSGMAPNFRLELEELWYCLENPATNVNPSVLVASGSTSLQLACESHAGITGAPDDIVTICDGQSSSNTINGTQIDKQSLPPFSLVTAYPVHGGCTFDSVVNPTFYYRGMFFETNPFPANDPNSATLTRFTAGLTGPGFADFFFYQNKAISGSGVNTVYTCAVYYDGKPTPQHWNCTYSFNPHTKTITQDKVWECSDKNPNQPLYFDGSGTFDWTMDPNYTCSTPDGNTIRCYWNGDRALLQPGVPYDIPKVTASLVNVLPPNYGQSNTSSTVRVNGKWQNFSIGS